MTEETTHEIKDIRVGDTVRIDGRICKVAYIEQSPWILHKGNVSYHIELEYLEDDLGEMLADLV